MSFAASYCQVIKINEWCIHKVNFTGKLTLYFWRTSSTDMPTQQLFLSPCQVFIWVTDKRQKRSVISEDLHVTPKVSRNFVNKDKKQ